MAKYEMLLRITKENGGVTEEVWWEARSEKGYECSHAYWSEEDYRDHAEDTAFDATAEGESPGPPSCGWCIGQKLPAILTPCDVITCPSCDELVGAGDAFANHLRECGT